MDEGSDVIELNVGGERMATLRSTLCQVEDSLLASMFSGRWEDSMSRDKEGRIFLDFDPKYFALILGHLRAQKISTPDNPPILPNVPFKKDKNFHLLVEYLGLTNVMLPELTECFKEHSEGMELEENGTAAVFHSKQKTVQVVCGRRKENLHGYSLSQNEFLFGKNIYKEGTIRLRLEIDIEFASYVYSDSSGAILVGVVPPTVLNKHAKDIHYSKSENFYGHEMNINNFNKTPIAIELVLDCDNGMLCINFVNGGYLDVKLPAGCSKWKLFFKLRSSSYQGDLQQPLHVRVAIAEYVMEY